MTMSAIKAADVRTAVDAALDTLHESLRKLNHQVRMFTRRHGLVYN